MNAITRALSHPAATSAGDGGDDPLTSLGTARVAAARRLDAAIVELEAAATDMLAADRRFFDQLRRSGHDVHGGHLRVPRLLRTLLVGQMQKAAPSITRHLGIPHVPARAQGSIGDAMERIVANDMNI